MAVTAIAVEVARRLSLPTLRVKTNGSDALGTNKMAVRFKVGLAVGPKFADTLALKHGIRDAARSHDHEYSNGAGALSGSYEREPSMTNAGAAKSAHTFRDPPRIRATSGEESTLMTMDANEANDSGWLSEIKLADKLT